MKIINRVKKAWNTLPNGTKNGAKFIVAETTLMSISGALKKHKNASKALHVAGIACYAAGVYQLIKGMHEEFGDPNEEYFKTMAHENAVDIMNGVRKNHRVTMYTPHNNYDAVSKYKTDLSDDDEYDDHLPEIDHDQF